MTIKELLEEILNWMIENDYECGEQGSEICKEIHKHLDRLDKSARNE